jgi:hypothetical protein
MEIPQSRANESIQPSMAEPQQTRPVEVPSALNHLIALNVEYGVRRNTNRLTYVSQRNDYAINCSRMKQSI